MDQFIVPLTAAAAVDAERVGPKAANLAALARAGPADAGRLLPERGCLSGADRGARARRPWSAASPTLDPGEQRRLSVEIRLGLYEQPIAPADPRAAAAPHGRRSAKRARGPSAVRSSALIEDRKGANFAGQFESFLGIDDEAAFLTAVRACWAALWTTNARRYMENHGLSPADTAMAVLIQPLVDARASGGGLSETAEGQMLISATWGLGSAIAQGEVVPDRIVLSRQGFLRKIDAGRKDHRETCGHGAGAVPQAVPSELVARAVPRRRAGGHARPHDAQGGSRGRRPGRDRMGARRRRASSCCRRGRCTVEPTTVPDEIWLKHPGLNGHPAGIGWGAGRAVVVNCECELARVAPGDVLVTRVAGPALSHVLPRVAGVVAELGGSTSHLASLARERGIPMVLGVLDATSRIPDGSQVAVDGVAGVVRWIT